MFSNLSSSSISLATDTPSLVTVGAPKDLSSTTLRPFGPRVTFTALASVFTPSSMRLRASSPKRTSFAVMYLFLYLSVAVLVRWLAFEDAEDLAFAQDEQFFTVHLHRAAGILTEENL